MTSIYSSRDLLIYWAVTSSFPVERQDGWHAEMDCVTISPKWATRTGAKPGLINNTGMNWPFNLFLSVLNNPKKKITSQSDCVITEPKLRRALWISVMVIRPRVRLRSPWRVWCSLSPLAKSRLERLPQASWISHGCYGCCTEKLRD